MALTSVKRAEKEKKKQKKTGIIRISYSYVHAMFRSVSDQLKFHLEYVINLDY